MKKASKFKNILIGAACVAGTLTPSFSSYSSPVHNSEGNNLNSEPKTENAYGIDKSTLQKDYQENTQNSFYTTSSENMEFVYNSVSDTSKKNNQELENKVNSIQNNYETNKQVSQEQSQKGFYTTPSHNIEVVYNSVPEKKHLQEVKQDSVKVINKRGKTLEYVTREYGKKNLVYSTKHQGRYSEKISNKIKKKLGNTKDGFYGDINFNAFVSPYLKHNQIWNLDYYGSGNIVGANGTINDVRNWEDYDAILGSQLPQADIDRDGDRGTQADKDMFYDYLINLTCYLPSDFELLQTRTEKEFWSSTFTTIDDLHSQSWNVCTNASTQAQVDASGIENILESGLNFSVIDTNNNGLHNGAYYQNSTVYINGVAHSINAILVGPDPIIFYDWEFREPQTGQIVSPGDPSMHPDSYAYVKKDMYFWNPAFNEYQYGYLDMVSFDLNNGVPSAGTPDPNLVLEKPDDAKYQIHVGGNNPVADTTILYTTAYANSLPDTSITGSVTGNRWYTTVYPSDTDNRSGIPGDSANINFDYWREFEIKSDSNNVVDSITMTDDVRYASTADPAQWVKIRDWVNPDIIRNQYIYNIPFSEWFANGIALSTVTDNSGYWDSEHFQTNTFGINPDSCNYWNGIVTDSTFAWDPVGNDTSDVFDVTVYMDPDQWTYFPPPTTMSYWDTISPQTTGGPAQASNLSGAGVIVTDSLIKYQNPDTLSPGHYEYPAQMIYTKTNVPCGNSSDSIQNISVYYPYSVEATFIPDSIIIGPNDPNHPDFTGWAEGTDTSLVWYSVQKEWYDEIIFASPTDTLKYRHWSLGNIVNDFKEKGIQPIYRDLTIGEEELNSLEKELMIYPNPTHSGKVYVKINSEVKGLRNVYWEAYDMNGSLVANSKESILPGMNEFVIDLSGQENGMYFLHFIVNNELIQLEQLIFY